MSVDMSQFHQVFFEESFENLDDMESGLLALDKGSIDDETINTIFRAAHSIKGGSGTFGFSEIADFTHVLETLLDEVRMSGRDVSRDVVQMLLQSVDCLREMLSAARDNTALDMQHVKSLQHKLELLVNADNAVSEADVKAQQTETQSNTLGWFILFHPYLHMLQTGNDPVLMFRELDQLGQLSVIANTTQVPALEYLDPEESYISWELKLLSDCSEAQVKEIFEWVDDDCALQIIPLTATDSNTTGQQVALVAADEELAEIRTGAKQRRQQEQLHDGEDRQNSIERRAAADRRSGEDRRGISGGESTSIRVNIDKIDTLINMVGELVITQSMLSQFGDNFDMQNLGKLRNGLDLLERNTRELQENVMQIRMLPISFSFNRFPRLVHELSSKLGKKVELKMSGEQTELDKTVMEKIGDPLVHLVRNSLDHGIELPEVRKAAGKPETGIIELNAYHKGGSIIIEITDDGAGLDTEKILAKAHEHGWLRKDEVPDENKIHSLIFHAGFSTVETVSDVSGRGVGLDVVKRNIKDLGGMVEVKSRQGQGSTFTIRLPLTLAILDGQLIRVGNNIYIIPLISIVESIQVQRNNYNSIVGKMELYHLRNDYIPVIRLHKVFNVTADSTELVNGLLVVVEAEGQKAGIFVDDLLAQQQVVIKSLETNYKKVLGVSGATILGDGTVALIMDISGLIDLSREKMAESGMTESELKAIDKTSNKAA